MHHCDPAVRRDVPLQHSARAVPTATANGSLSTKQNPFLQSVDPAEGHAVSGAVAGVEERPHPGERSPTPHPLWISLAAWELVER